MGIALRTLAWVSPLLGAALLAEPSLAQEAEAVADAMGGMAEEATPLDSGDVAWILTASAIVLMMTIPGLALFYGGLVRVKNVLSILMQCLITLSIVSVIWVLWGYSLAFAPDAGGGLVGDLSKLGLAGVSHEAGPEENIPELLFMVFQLMFAVITPALIVGAFAERMKFSAFLLFTALWSTLIYAPLCHWVWGPDGWLGARGALDFAGGLVVHMSSGFSALAAAIFLGKRLGYGREPMPPHNLPLTVAGACMLWVGWFGFNAGSAIASDGAAGMAMLVTHLGAACGSLAWMTAEWIRFGKPSVLGIVTGMVAGLGTITPASGFVGPGGAIVIGLAAGSVCFTATQILKRKLKIDDSLDVFPVHGVGGMLGILLTGVFASSQFGGMGLPEGVSIAQQLVVQATGMLATIAWCGLVTFVLLKLVNAIVPLRVSDDQETEGLDLVLHEERGYDL